MLTNIGDGVVTLTIAACCKSVKEVMVKQKASTILPTLFLLLFGSSCGAGKDLILGEDDDLRLNCSAHSQDEFESVEWFKDRDQGGNSIEFKNLWRKLGPTLRLLF